MSLNSFRTGMGRLSSNTVIRWAIFVVGALLAFSLVFSGLGGNLGGNGSAAGAPGAPDEVVATVDKIPITRAEYEKTVSTAQSQSQMMGQNVTALQAAPIHNYALDQLVTAKLLLQYAQKLGLKASSADINQERRKIAAQDGLPQQLGLKPDATLAEIDAALAKQQQPPLESNPQLSDENMTQQVLLEKLQATVAAQVTVTEQQVRDSYQQYHTRHILIDNKKRSDVQAQAQANQILAKAKAPGADFAALAKQYSEDPGTKNSGGDDGWIDQSTSYVPEFKKAAFALKPGQVTLVKSPQYGYFIIKLDAARQNLPKDLDKNKAQYIAQYKEQQQRDKLQSLITSLKNDPATKIVVKDPALRADRKMADAESAGDPAQKAADYKAAVADYQAALKSNDSVSQPAEVNAALARAYQALHQPPQAIAAYQAAITGADEPDLHMALGELYQQDKQTKEAIAQYQEASKSAWDDQNIHLQLLMAYSKLKRPDLAAKENAWIKDYQKRQMAQQSPSSLSLSPQTAGGVTPGGAIHVAPTAGAPAKSGKKPTQ